MPNGGRLSFSWSPGGSGTETMDVELDSSTLGSITRTGTIVSGWWDEKERFVETFNVDPLDAGDHTLTFDFSSGDGSVWDWIRLEMPCEEVVEEVFVDIKPTSCPNPLNVGSKGVISVAILGTDEFDVTQVDPDTILLKGVKPLRWSLEDVATPYEGDLLDRNSCTIAGPDGYIDLVFKFDTQEVATALGSVTDGDEILLTLTGNLFDSTAIAGEDIVWILKKGKK